MFPGSIDELQRAIRTAGTSERGLDAVVSMRNMKATVVDVGIVSPFAGDESGDDLNAVVGDSTLSEQAA